MTAAEVDYGCDYCADWANRAYGHVTQIRTHAQLSLLLLRCPRYETQYEHLASATARGVRHCGSCASDTPHVALDD